MIRKLLSQPRHNTSSEFRWRSSEGSRLEELREAVIGFALLIVIWYEHASDLIQW
jgi:hypothetical protein